MSEDALGSGDGGRGARPKSGTQTTLQEAMQRGREQREQEEESAGGGRSQVQEEAVSGKPDEDSDSEELMMIAGLSEVALLLKKPASVYGTGFVYDERFARPRNEWHPGFPERPERVTQPYARCCDLGLVDRCTRVQAQFGTEDQILSQHSPRLIEVLQSSIEMDQAGRMALSKQFEDVYFHQTTYETALLAVGTTIDLMEQVLKKNVRNGFSLQRPPGHHAMNDAFCGFCFYNNIAIAADHAINNLGLSRVLIVDWDVHHGQATQQMFYNDPRVLYMSIHRYEYGEYWPSLRESDYDYIGDGDGIGYNVNVPLNQVGLGDSDYLAIFHQVLMPIAYEFSPEVVLISSGYDAAIGCPEFGPELVLVSSGYDAAIGDVKGEMMVSPVAYAHFVHMMSGLAEGRVCAILEGGYHLGSLSEGVAMSVRSLLGDPCPLLKPTQEPSDSITESILNVIKCISPYWKCLQYQPTLEDPDECCYPGVNVDPPKPGMKFETDETRPKEFGLDYIYPHGVEEEYRKAESKWDTLIGTMIAETNLMVPPHRTCLVYDEAMKAHRAIDMPRHPEKPERISRIYNKHVEWDLVERCLRIECRMAEHSELELVHSPALVSFTRATAELTSPELSVLQQQYTLPGEHTPHYFSNYRTVRPLIRRSQHIEDLMELEDKDIGALRSLQSKFNSIYLNKETYNCASLAVGGTLNILDSIFTGQARNGVAIVRPPGHHAECGKPMGFCFFNTVAVAAKYAQKKHNVNRVLILDWDVHHGNGTQHMFYDDPSILYISLHRYDGGFFFPTSPDGGADMAGAGAGLGYNVNIPWNYGGKGDPEYIAAFHQIVMPIAYEFAPDLVLVSAGFDAAIGDPLGGCKLTPAGYGHMTHMLSGLANGRVVLVLEGGYNLVSIANCMSTCTSVLLGDPVPYWKYDSPQPGAVTTICDVLDVHKQYWKSLKFRVGIPKKIREESQSSSSSEDDSDSQGGTDDDNMPNLEGLSIGQDCRQGGPQMSIGQRE